MKNIIVMFFLLFSVRMTAQDSTKVKIYQSVLQVGEVMNYGKGSIKFNQVISDSRCPEGVACIWAGEAKVLVEVFTNGTFIKEKIITIGAAGEFPLKFSEEGVEFIVDNLLLSPYPGIVDKTSKEPIPYLLNIQIRELLNCS